MQKIDCEKILGEYEAQSVVLKAIAHPVRLCILNGLMNNNGCNVNHMQDCLCMPQSTISTHLAKLKNAGVVKGNRVGKEIIYTINNDEIKEILIALGGIK